MTAYAIPSTIQPSSIDVWIATESVIAGAQRDSGIRSAWELPRSAWRCAYSFEYLNNAKKRTLQGFLARIDGPVGLITVKDPDYDYDYSIGLGGKATGTITATGNKDAKIISLSGVTGPTPSFLAGDRIGVAGSVYQVVADANAASGNIAALEIRPRLRANASGAAVILTGLTWQMQLLDDRQTKMTIDSVGHVHGLTLNLVEYVT